MSIDRITKTNFVPTKLPTKVPAEKVNEIIDALNENILSSATTITALAGGGATGATLLTSLYNNITVSATAKDSVMLPKAVAGKVVYVKNNGAAALDVFPYTGDKINDLAADLAVTVPVEAEVKFTAISTTEWQTNTDTIVLTSPSTQKGTLVLRAADSAGETQTLITNASQAAARNYTIPDAGTTNASFVMSAGASSLAGVRTFSDVTASTTKDTGAVVIEGGLGVEKEIFAGLSINAGTYLLSGNGTVALPAIGPTSDPNSGLYVIGADNLGIACNGAKVLDIATTGLGVTGLLTSTSSISGLRHLHSTNLGTTPVGTVVISEYGTGRDVVTELTLTNFIVGALAGAGAALGVGNIVYAFPAGQHFELVSSLSAIVLTALGTAVATDTGLGSVIATGAVNVLSGTGTFEDRLTGQTISTAAGGGAAVSALTAATTGIGTGISLNVAASVKNVFLNSAGTWNADNTGNLTATGVIVLKWVKM